MIKKKTPRHLVDYSLIVLLTLIFLFYTYILGEIILDPGDGLKHFLIAKYAWLYPHLFFDHWGKPLFTLLSSLYAQFGFQGMITFNISLFVITGVLILKIAKLLSLKHAWLAVLFCFASPIYFSIVLSGLTEILLATLILLALFFFLKEQFILGCLTLSFSYFSRPESIFIIMWFLAYIIYIKKYKYIPFLGVSIILYSVVGNLYYEDIFWVFTKRPYSSTGTYGSGELFHFIVNYKHTFGSVISLTFLVGIVIVFFNFIKKRFVNVQTDLKWMLLILFPILSVVGVHSILWWKGMQGSAGLLRVLATIVPLVALVSLFAVNNLEVFLTNKYKQVKGLYITIFFIITGGVLIFQTSSNLFIDARMVSSEETLLETAEWYNKEERGTKIYYMPPYFSYVAELDPFGEHTNMEMFKHFKDKKKPSNNMINGELILWDGQFSAVEGKISLAMLEADPNLLHIKIFLPEKPFKIYGKSYEVHIFKKVKDRELLEIDLIINRIKNDPDWLKSIQIQAKERGVSVEKSIEINARFVLKNRKSSNN
ncbi:MAG: hypothetical protein HRT73_00065 [Flavobacteriales bacterium]|nr:hypothetical protein [Flavobacteriales bacterium]